MGRQESETLKQVKPAFKPWPFERGYRQKLVHLPEALMVIVAERFCHGSSRRAVNAITSLPSRPPRRTGWFPAIPRTASGHRLVAEADKIMKWEFDTLGVPAASENRQACWSTDAYAGYVWPMRYHKLMTAHPAKSSSPDIRIPWELSRFHHALIMARAFEATRDERYAECVVAQLLHWQSENPYLFGIHWFRAMEVAIRAVNWIYLRESLADSKAWTADVDNTILQSLWLHGEFIWNNMENRGGIETNHYVANLVGLAFIGRLFDSSPQAVTWGNYTADELERCVTALVADDGVYLENSTGYHLLVTEMFVYVAALFRKSGRESTRIEQRLQKMFEFLEAVCRPDDQLPLMGDNDDGIILPHESINEDRYHRDRIGRLKQIAGIQRGKEPGSAAYRAGGVYVARTQSFHLVVSAWRPGIKGTAPHMHNDWLSFELSISGHPIIVDPGTYCYGGDRQQRCLFRSTAYHNTLRVDGEDQLKGSDALFSLPGDQGDIRAIEWQAGREEAVCAAEHTGYHRLDDPVTHRRRLAINEQSGELCITDTVHGASAHDLEWSFHLSPSCSISQVGETFDLSVGGKPIATIKGPSTCKASMVEGRVSRGYRKKEAAKILRFETRGTLPAAYEFCIRRIT